jgi:multidrug resistance efflux pump
MSAIFFRTVRELEADNSFAAMTTLAIVAALSSLWCAWLFLARVPVYRSTDRARLLLARGYEADAAVSGRIVAIDVALGQEVHTGDNLVELDSEAERRELEEHRTSLAVIAPELEQVYAAINAEEKGLESTKQTGGATLDQAQVRWQQAEGAARVSDEIAKRYLAASDAVPRIEVLRAEATAQSDRAKANASRLEIGRTAQDQQTHENDRAARLRQLQQQRMRLQGEQRTTKAQINRLEYAIDKRHIRAPTNGRVAALDILRVGGFIRAGEQVAAILPPNVSAPRERLRAIAEFSPSAALGRIHPGQPAWVHLAGFPWTQYGTISATVTSVASDPTASTDSGAANTQQEKRIRVELKLDPESAPLIPIQYGLPGTAEVEVERISPARLIMRAAGQLMTKPTASKRY